MSTHATSAGSAARFPPGFLWGCATSAYQIEGSPLADGAGASIWHRFAHTPGRVAGEHSGDVACDHYRRYADDIELMSELRMQAYRFSIAWGRVLPEGIGRINPPGLDFYDRLVDRLLAKNIVPMATLYHWDLPAALDDQGGWLNRDSAHWFAEYAELMFRRLDDRVRFWCTVNEPWVITDGGYLHGTLAPGHRSAYEAPLASHNVLRAHGAAVQAYRALGGRQRIGLVVNLEPKYPASQDPADLAALRRADAYMNRQYLDPALLGTYPSELEEIFQEAWPSFPAQDFVAIRQPLDFLGVNYYTRSVTRNDPHAWPVRASSVRQCHQTHTAMGWEVFPQGLTDTLVWLKERYGDVPLYVTENGAAFYDPPQVDGTHEDPLRVDYLRKHIAAVHAAIRQGVDVRGYFVWSLLDNFEWAQGFTKRFGIVHVNYQTLARTPKASARWYADVIDTHGGALIA